MKFDSYHPIINFIYFAAVIVCTISFFHPVFLVLTYTAAFVWSCRLNGKKALIFNLCLIPCIFMYAAWYSFYNHFGVTNLWVNRIGNNITLESIVYGFVRGIMISAVIMELSCVFATVTADKVVYLLGRISPKLSLFLSILLRSVPRIKNQAKKIDTARQGVGRGIRQGNLWQKFCHFLGVISILITWSTEHLVESAMSMKSRGYSLKGRSAFSIYRFDNRDRCFVVAIVFSIMGIFVAHMAGETNILYDPVIRMEPITGRIMIFFMIYGIFLFLPVALQSIGEIRFKQARNGAL